MRVLSRLDLTDKCRYPVDMDLESNYRELLAQLAGELRLFGQPSTLTVREFDDVRRYIRRCETFVFAVDADRAWVAHADERRTWRLDSIPFADLDALRGVRA